MIKMLVYFGFIAIIVLYICYTKTFGIMKKWKRATFGL